MLSASTALRLGRVEEFPRIAVIMGTLSVNLAIGEVIPFATQGMPRMGQRARFLDYLVPDVDSR